MVLATCRTPDIGRISHVPWRRA